MPSDDEDKAFDVKGASLIELEAEFDRLADGRLRVFTAFTNARTGLENKLAEFEMVYGKIEVLNTIISSLLGDSPTDGSPGDNPYSTDWLDAADTAMVYVGAITTAVGTGYTLYSGLRAFRGGNAGATVANVADDAAGAVAAGAVRWPRLRFVGGVIGTLGGVGLAGLGVYLAARDNQERRTFYETNIPIYEAWYNDTESTTTAMNNSTAELENILKDLQASLGYEQGAPGRATMIDELGGAVGQAGEFVAQFTAATKMLCKNISVPDVVEFTGLSTAVVTKRKDQILSDATICPTTLGS